MNHDLNDKFHEAIKNIAKNHRQIIDDWCKAYLAQLYEEGKNIKPGCFTLNEQQWDKDGIGKRYWFVEGVPDYPERHQTTFKEALIEFLDNHKTLSWNLSGKNYGDLHKAIEEFFTEGV